MEKRHAGLGGLHQILWRGGVETDTHRGEAPWGRTQGRCRDWRDAAWSQGAPRPAAASSGWDRPGADSPSQPQEGTSPVDPLILHFGHPKLGAHEFLSSEATQSAAFVTVGPGKRSSRPRCCPSQEALGPWLRAGLTLAVRCQCVVPHPPQGREAGTGLLGAPGPSGFLKTCWCPFTQVAILATIC